MIKRLSICFNYLRKMDTENRLAEASLQNEEAQEQQQVQQLYGNVGERNPVESAVNVETQISIEQSGKTTQMHVSIDTRNNYEDRRSENSIDRQTSPKGGRGASPNGQHGRHKSRTGSPSLSKYLRHNNVTRGSRGFEPLKLQSIGKVEPGSLAQQAQQQPTAAHGVPAATECSQTQTHFETVSGIDQQEGQQQPVSQVNQANLKQSQAPRTLDEHQRQLNNQSSAIMVTEETGLIQEEQVHNQANNEIQHAQGSVSNGPSQLSNYTNREHQVHIQAVVSLKQNLPLSPPVGMILQSGDQQLLELYQRQTQELMRITNTGLPSPPTISAANLQGISQIAQMPQYQQVQPAQTTITEVKDQTIYRNGACQVDEAKLPSSSGHDLTSIIQYPSLKLPDQDDRRQNHRNSMQAGVTGQVVHPHHRSGSETVMLTTAVGQPFPPFYQMPSQAVVSRAAGVHFGETFGQNDLSEAGYSNAYLTRRGEPPTTQIVLGMVEQSPPGSGQTKVAYESAKYKTSQTQQMVMLGAGSTFEGQQQSSRVAAGQEIHLVKVPKPVKPLIVERNVVGGGTGKYAANQTNVKGGPQAKLNRSNRLATNTVTIQYPSQRSAIRPDRTPDDTRTLTESEAHYGLASNDSQPTFPSFFTKNAKNQQKKAVGKANSKQMKLQSATGSELGHGDGKMGMPSLAQTPFKALQEAQQINFVEMQHPAGNQVASSARVTPTIGKTVSDQQSIGVQQAYKPIRVQSVMASSTLLQQDEEEDDGGNTCLRAIMQGNKGGHSAYKVSYLNRPSLALNATPSANQSKTSPPLHPAKAKKGAFEQGSASMTNEGFPNSNSVFQWDNLTIGTAQQNQTPRAAREALAMPPSEAGQLSFKEYVQKYGPNSGPPQAEQLRHVRDSVVSQASRKGNESKRHGSALDGHAMGQTHSLVNSRHPSLNNTFVPRLQALKPNRLGQRSTQGQLGGAGSKRNVEFHNLKGKRGGGLEMTKKIYQKIALFEYNAAQANGRNQRAAMANRTQQVFHLQHHRLDDSSTNSFTNNKHSLKSISPRHQRHHQATKPLDLQPTTSLQGNKAPRNRSCYIDAAHKATPEYHAPASLSKVPQRPSLLQLQDSAQLDSDTLAKHGLYLEEAMLMNQLAVTATQNQTTSSDDDEGVEGDFSSKFKVNIRKRASTHTITDSSAAVGQGALGGANSHLSSTLKIARNESMDKAGMGAKGAKEGAAVIQPKYYATIQAVPLQQQEMGNFNANAVNTALQTSNEDDPHLPSGIPHDQVPTVLGGGGHESQTSIEEPAMERIYKQKEPRKKKKSSPPQPSHSPSLKAETHDYIDQPRPNVQNVSGQRAVYYQTQTAGFINHGKMKKGGNQQREGRRQQQVMGQTDYMSQSPWRRKQTKLAKEDKLLTADRIVKTKIQPYDRAAKRRQSLKSKSPRELIEEQNQTGMILGTSKKLLDLPPQKRQSHFQNGRNSGSTKRAVVTTNGQQASGSLSSFLPKLIKRKLSGMGNTHTAQMADTGISVIHTEIAGHQIPLSQVPSALYEDPNVMARSELLDNLRVTKNSASESPPHHNDTASKEPPQVTNAAESQSPKQERRQVIKILDQSKWRQSNGNFASGPDNSFMHEAGAGLMRTLGTDGGQEIMLPISTTPDGQPNTQTDSVVSSKGEKRQQNVASTLQKNDSSKLMMFNEMGDEEGGQPDGIEYSASRLQNKSNRQDDSALTSSVLQKQKSPIDLAINLSVAVSTQNQTKENIRAPYATKKRDGRKSNMSYNADLKQLDVMAATPSASLVKKTGTPIPLINLSPQVGASIGEHTAKEIASQQVSTHGNHSHSQTAAIRTPANATTSVLDEANVRIGISAIFAQEEAEAYERQHVPDLMQSTGYSQFIKQGDIAADQQSRDSRQDFMGQIQESHLMHGTGGLQGQIYQHENIDYMSLSQFNKQKDANGLDGEGGQQSSGLINQGKLATITNLDFKNPGSSSRKLNKSKSPRGDQGMAQQNRTQDIKYPVGVMNRNSLVPIEKLKTQMMQTKFLQKQRMNQTMLEIGHQKPLATIQHAMDPKRALSTYRNSAFIITPNPMVMTQATRFSLHQRALSELRSKQNQIHLSSIEQSPMPRFQPATSLSPGNGAGKVKGRKKSTSVPPIAKMLTVSKSPQDPKPISPRKLKQIKDREARLEQLQVKQEKLIAMQKMQLAQLAEKRNADLPAKSVQPMNLDNAEHQTIEAASVRDYCSTNMGKNTPMLDDQNSVTNQAQLLADAGQQPVFVNTSGSNTAYLPSPANEAAGGGEISTLPTLRQTVLQPPFAIKQSKLFGPVIIEKSVLPAGRTYALNQAGVRKGTRFAPKQADLSNVLFQGDSNVLQTHHHQIDGGYEHDRALSSIIANYQKQSQQDDQDHSPKSYKMPANFRHGVDSQIESEKHVPDSAEAGGRAGANQPALASGSKISPRMPVHSFTTTAQVGGSQIGGTKGHTHKTQSSQVNHRRHILAEKNNASPGNRKMEKFINEVVRGDSIELAQTLRIAKQASQKDDSHQVFNKGRPAEAIKSQLQDSVDASVNQHQGILERYIKVTDSMQAGGSVVIQPHQKESLRHHFHDVHLIPTEPFVEQDHVEPRGQGAGANSNGRDEDLIRLDTDEISQAYRGRDSQGGARGGNEDLRSNDRATPDVNKPIETKVSAAAKSMLLSSAQTLEAEAVSPLRQIPARETDRFTD